MNPIILELVKNGVSVKLVWNDDEHAVHYYIESGFYKSDGCTYLVESGEDLILCSRYDIVENIYDLDDIIAQSKYWYEVSCDRYSGWNTPPNVWAELYKRLN